MGKPIQNLFSILFPFVVILRIVSCFKLNKCVKILLVLGKKENSLFYPEEKVFYYNPKKAYFVANLGALNCY